MRNFMFTVHNKGQREIQFNGGILNPDSYAKLDEKEALKLQSLFAKEIIIIEKVAEIAEASVPADVEVIEAPEAPEVAEIAEGAEIEESVELESLNKNQLLDIAKQMGFVVGDKATKKDLIALISEEKNKEPEVVETAEAE